MRETGEERRGGSDDGCEDGGQGNYALGAKLPPPPPPKKERNGGRRRQQTPESNPRQKDKERGREKSDGALAPSVLPSATAARLGDLFVRPRWHCTCCRHLWPEAVRRRKRGSPRICTWCARRTTRQRSSESIGRMQCNNESTGCPISSRTWVGLTWIWDIPQACSGR